MQADNHHHYDYGTNIAPPAAAAAAGVAIPTDDGTPELTCFGGQPAQDTTSVNACRCIFLSDHLFGFDSLAGGGTTTLGLYGSSK